MKQLKKEDKNNMKNKLLILLAAVLATSCVPTTPTDAEIDEIYRKMKISNDKWSAEQAKKTQKQRTYENMLRKRYERSRYTPSYDYRTNMHVINSLYGY